MFNLCFFRCLRQTLLGLLLRLDKKFVQHFQQHQTHLLWDRERSSAIQFISPHVYFMDRTFCIVWYCFYFSALFSLYLPFSSVRFVFFALFYLYFPFWLILGIISVFVYAYSPPIFFLLYLAFSHKILTNKLNTAFCTFHQDTTKKCLRFRFYRFARTLARKAAKRKEAHAYTCTHNETYSFEFYNFLFGCIQCFPFDLFFLWFYFPFILLVM